jgi:RNA polymerase sigma factor (sigma-70 family)
MDGRPIDKRQPQKVKVIPGEFKDHDGLCRAAEHAQSLAAQRVAWADARLAGKTAGRGNLQRLTRLWQARENALSVVYYDYKKKKKRWPQSQSHINERSLAARYGVPMASLRQWRQNQNFPSPIQDFHPFKPPTQKWWHLSAVVEWERTRARRVEIQPEVIKPKYGARIFDGADVNLVSLGAKVRSKTNNARAKQDALALECAAQRPQDVIDAEINALAAAAAHHQFAFSKLVSALLPDVRFMARRYAKRDGRLFDELVSEAISGNLTKDGRFANGLRYALEKYVPQQGVPFRVFMKESIRWAMTAYLDKLNAARRKSGVSLDQPICGDDEDSNKTITDREIDDTIYSDELITELDERVSSIQEALDCLDARERHVIERYYGLDGNPPATMDEIGSGLGRSRERCRQIASGATAKLRKKCSEQTGNSNGGDK